MKKAFYRYVKFSYGTQGTSDSKKTLSDWIPMENFNNSELQTMLNTSGLSAGWDELRIETIIK